MLTDSPMASLAEMEEIDPKLSRIINFYSDGSFYAMDDPSALVNNRIPKYSRQSPLIPPHPFETFCFAVAACGNEPTFDHLCDRVFDEVFGPRTFLDLCTDVGRTRSQTRVNETQPTL
jgi:hypothetical protein